MIVQLVDTSAYDGQTAEVRDPPPEVLELPTASGIVAAREELEAGKAYRGPNVTFHLRLTAGGEYRYVASHLLPTYDGRAK